MAKPTDADMEKGEYFASNCAFRRGMVKLGDLPYFEGVECRDGPKIFGEHLNALFQCHFADRRGCDNLSCYPVDREGKLCKVQGPIHYKNLEFCQKACFAETLDGTKVKFPETLWHENQCVVANTALRRFCTEPHFRGNPSWHPSLNWSQQEQTCRIDSNYCLYYGMDFADGDCVVSANQRFVENYITGKSLYRYFKSRQKRSKVATGLLLDISPEVGALAMKMTSKEMAKIVSTEPVKQIIGQSSKRLLKYATRGYFLSRVKAVLIANALKHGLIYSTVAITMVCAFLSAILSASSTISIGLTLTGMFLDAVDPSGLKYQLSKKQVDEYSANFWNLYAKSLPYGETKYAPITPEMVFDLIAGTTLTSEESVSRFVDYHTYLNSLRTNSLGQIIQWGTVGEFELESTLDAIYEHANQRIAANLLAKERKYFTETYPLTYALVLMSAISGGLYTYTYRTKCLGNVTVIAILLTLGLFISWASR